MTNINSNNPASDREMPTTPHRIGADETSTRGMVIKGIKGMLEKEKEKLMTTPFCETCNCSSSCTDKQGDCSFQLASRDDLLTRLIVYTYGADETTDTKAIVDKLYETFVKVYGGADIDVYSGYVNNEICNKCNGSGIYVSDTIALCDKCNGTKLTPRDIKPGFHKAYITFSRTRWGDGILQYGDTVTYYGIFKDESLAQESIKWFNTKIAEHSSGSVRERECAAILLSDRLDGVDLGCFSDGGDAEDGETLVVLDTTANNKIVTIGDWKSIHDVLGLSYYNDIEYYTHGEYIVESLVQFNQKYQIATNTQMDRLYEHVFANIISTCMNCATYGGAESVIVKYTNKYPTIADIRANIMKHLEPVSNYVLNPEYIEVIDKIIDDFSLIGLQISKAQAAKVIADSSLTTEEYIAVSNIMDYNAVGVFLIECAIILREYSELDS